MNTFDNKISIIDNKLNVINFEYDIDDTVDLVSKTEQLTKLASKEIPFSLIRAKIIILVPGNINKNTLDKITEIIFKSSKYREMVSINEGLVVFNVFWELNRCAYLIKTNNIIFGFAACAGQLITKVLYFNNSNSIDFMLDQINNEITENSFIELKASFKNIDLKDINLDSLWNNNKIIISFDPEYYNNKNVQNIQNSYIDNILHRGLIKSAMKLFYNADFGKNSV